jgi:hypothetical protein
MTASRGSGAVARDLLGDTGWRTLMDRRCGLSAVMLARALSVALLSVPALAAEDPTALVAEAAAAHPSLQALEASERALRERAEVAGSWGDPVVALEYSNAPISSLSISDHPMAGLQGGAGPPGRRPGLRQRPRRWTGRRRRWPWRWRCAAAGGRWCGCG